MPINFVPERGRLLICDFDRARVHPENSKLRRVVVLSPRSYNERHGAGPGRCIVVPFSASQPVTQRLSDVFFAFGRYRALSKDTWANCGSVATVSHARLDRVYIGHGRYSDELLSADDCRRIEIGLRHALGFQHPSD